MTALWQPRPPPASIETHQQNKKGPFPLFYGCLLRFRYPRLAQDRSLPPPHHAQPGSLPLHALFPTRLLSPQQLFRRISYDPFRTSSQRAALPRNGFAETFSVAAFSSSNTPCAVGNGKVLYHVK